jgi:hypothetical protein
MNNKYYEQAEVIDKLTQEMVDRGLLIESGWVALRLMTLPKDTPQAQLDDMRNAFFAGAQHLFGSIMSMLDPEDEPTDSDLRRMDQIRTELEKFIRDYEAKNLNGSA